MRTDVRKRALIVAAIGVTAIIVISFGAVLYLSAAAPMQDQRPTKEPRAPSSSQPYPTEREALDVEAGRRVISINPSSPDASYSVSQEIVGEYNRISVQRTDGTAVVDDFLQENADALYLNKPYRCQCFVTFAGWVSNVEFVVHVEDAFAEVYEFTADARTGAVNGDSFRRIR